MTLEEHDETDSLLDELEAAERRDAASLPSDADGISEADMIAAAVEYASAGGFEYAEPPDTVALVTTGTKASESTQYETAAAAVGGDEAAPESPRGSFSSASKTSAPAPSSTSPAMFRAGPSSPPRSTVPPGGGIASRPSGSAPSPALTVRPALTPSGGSPATPSPVSVAAFPATPSPSGAPPPPAGAQPSNRQRLADALGTDIDMVDQSKLAVAVASLLEAAVAKVAQLGKQYEIVLSRLETCDESKYDEWAHRAELVMAQQTLEEGWLSYLRAQKSTVADAGSSGSSRSGKEAVTKRQQQKVTKFVEALHIHVPAFTSAKRINATTAVSAIEKWIRAMCDYLLSSLPDIGRLLAEAMAAYLSVGWAMRVGGSVEAPAVLGAGRVLTPMDPRPVGKHLEVVLGRTSLRRGSTQPYMKWVREVIANDIVHQTKHEYLQETLERLTDEIKKFIDPQVVKEITRGSADEPVLAATDVFQLLSNLLKDRGRGDLSRAKRLLAGLPQSPSLDAMSGRTLWAEIVHRAVEAYHSKLNNWSDVQSAVSMPIIFFDAVLNMFPSTAEDPPAAYVASRMVTGLTQWRDENLQATAQACMERLQEELKRANDSAPMAGFVWPATTKTYADAAAAHVDRGRSETRGPHGSRPGTPVGGERGGSPSRGPQSPTRGRCHHKAADCWHLQHNGECIMSGHTQAERDAAWKAKQARDAPKATAVAVEAPKQQGANGGKGGKNGSGGTGGNGSGGTGGKGSGGKGKGGRGGSAEVVKANPVAAAARERNRDQRAQVDSDYAAVTPAEEAVAAAIRTVFNEAEGPAVVDLFAVHVGGTATGFSVPTHPMDPEFSSDLAVDLPYFPYTQAAPQAAAPPAAAVMASAPSTTTSVLAAPRAVVPWHASRAVVSSVSELERVFTDVFDGVAPCVAAMSPEELRVLLLRGGCWVTDTFGRALSAIALGGGTVWKVWEDFMDGMASRTGRSMPVGGRCVLVPRSESDDLLSPADRAWYAGELSRLEAAIEPVEAELAELPSAIVGGGAGEGVAGVQDAADGVAEVALQAAATRPAVSDSGAGGDFFVRDPARPDTVPVAPFRVRGATSDECLLMDRARWKNFCWPTVSGGAITLPRLGSSSPTLKTDLLSVGKMIKRDGCEYHLSPDPDNCYIEFPPHLTGTGKPERVQLVLGPDTNPTVRFPPELTEAEARQLRPVDGDLAELDRLLLADEQAKAQAERDRQLKQLDQAGKSCKPSLRIGPIVACPSAVAVPEFAPSEEADDAEAAAGSAQELSAADASRRFSPKFLRQVVTAAKQRFKASQSALSTTTAPVAAKPSPVAQFDRLNRQLQRLAGVSEARSAPSGPVVPVPEPAQLKPGPEPSPRLTSRRYQDVKKRHQKAKQKQSLLRAKEPEITEELIKSYKQSVQARVAGSAGPVVAIVYFNKTFKAARELLADMPNLRVLCVGILPRNLPLVVQTVKEFEGRLVYVKGHPKEIMSAKAVLDCVDEAWGLGARNVVYLQSHPTCATVSPAPLVQSTGHPHRGPDMEPLTTAAELDDKLRNGVMSLSRELSILCGPGYSAVVEQPAGIAEWVPSTKAILASSPWSKAYAPHCKLTPDPKAKVSRKSSVYFLLNVHPFDVECKKDCGHMLPSLEHHRYMIAPTAAHRKKGAQRLTGDDRVTVPGDLPYLMLGRQVIRFNTEASRPAAAEVEEEANYAGDDVLQAEAFAAAVKKLPRYPRHTLTAEQLHQACGHVNDATLLRSVKLFNGFALRRPDGKLIPGSKVVLEDIQRPRVCHTCMTTKVTAAQSRQQKGRVLVESRLPAEAKEYLRERDGRVTRSMAQRVQQAEALAASCTGVRPGVALAVP